MDEFIEFTPSLQHYKPILYLNDYWNLKKDYQPINETVKVLNLTITFQPLSLFKWQMYSAQQMKNRFNPMAGLLNDEEEEDMVRILVRFPPQISFTHYFILQDSMKEAMLETNVYLLVVTFIVSIVHSIFEFLAFKNGKEVSTYGFFPYY